MSKTIWIRKTSIRFGKVDEGTVRRRNGARFGRAAAGHLTGWWAPGISVLRIR